ncbi:MAG: DNA starvation/stationary phase protection protein [Pseudomonadota bacterium]
MNAHPGSVAAQPHDPDLPVEHRKGVAGGLSAALADTYLLMINTHAHHWNVMGPLFHAVHNLTEEQYQDMFEAVDVMAERIRALGELAPSNIAEMLENSAVKHAAPGQTAEVMVAELAEDHETVARRLHRLAAVAGENGDIVTEDLAVARCAFHEKAAWMLRAQIAG